MYHRGINGVHEAIYHAVPMVIFPFLFDQFALAAAIRENGIGLVLRKHEITEERLELTIIIPRSYPCGPNARIIAMTCNERLHG
ncbi:UDP-glucuronosyltransferase 3A1 [Holothuria leucospilota]|uniref:UDP-glucuronosyltransferase 3A1 n=1 Tax=Holothuria leucospilota TaxID=206669 RepID=A0A9Q1H9G3_HOLLE|nr:UDP-glucuronosyltransferase 3A1 [Holothuria leucospilota]